MELNQIPLETGVFGSGGGAWPANPQCGARASRREFQRPAPLLCAAGSGHIRPHWKHMRRSETRVLHRLLVLGMESCIVYGRRAPVRRDSPCGVASSRSASKDFRAARSASKDFRQPAAPARIGVEQPAARARTPTRGSRSYPCWRWGLPENPCSRCGLPENPCCAAGCSKILAGAAGCRKILARAAGCQCRLTAIPPTCGQSTSAVRSARRAGGRPIPAETILDGAGSLQGFLGEFLANWDDVLRRVDQHFVGFIDHVGRLFIARIVKRFVSVRRSIISGLSEPPTSNSERVSSAFSRRFCCRSPPTSRRPVGD